MEFDIGFNWNKCGLITAHGTGRSSEHEKKKKKKPTESKCQNRRKTHFITKQNHNSIGIFILYVEMMWLRTSASFTGFIYHVSCWYCVLRLYNNNHFCIKIEHIVTPTVYVWMNVTEQKTIVYNLSSFIIFFIFHKKIETYNTILGSSKMSGFTDECQVYSHIQTISVGLRTFL